MPEFSRLLLEPQLDGKTWIVAAPYTYRLPSGCFHTIAEGSITDLASTPRCLWIVLPPFGTWTRAAVLHDDIYKTGKLCELPCTREQADQVLRGVMDECGSKLGWVFYRAVRLGAGWTWKKYRDAHP